MNDKSKYIPALRFHWLTPIYDQLLKFNVTGVNGRTVVNAKLRLYSEGSSNRAGTSIALRIRPGRKAR